MKPQIIAAILLIVIGIAALAFQGFTYTTREKAIDLGPIQVTSERTHRVPAAPIVGAIALAGGITLLIIGRKTA